MSPLEASAVSLAQAPTEEEKHKMTLEALADVDAGRGIDHDVAVAWFESLDTDNPLADPF